MSAPTSLPFPKRDCSRCGGSGRYSYNSMHGDRCYGCSGTGRQFAGSKVSTLATEIRQRIRSQKEALASDVGAGDLLWIVAGRIASRIDRGDGGSWIEVLDVTHSLGERSGQSMSGSLRADPRAQWGIVAPVVQPGWTLSITLVDGTVQRRISSRQILRRKATDAIRRSDAARLLAACPKAHRSVYEEELVEAGWILEELR